MGESSALLTQLLALSLLLLTACTSIPPRFEDGAHEVDVSEAVVSGEILYHDNRNDFFVRDKEDASLDLKATIFQIPQNRFLDLTAKNRRVFTTKATVSGSDWAEAIQWTLRYYVGPSDTTGTSDYRIEPNQLPNDLVVTSFSTKDLKEKSQFPITLMVATWKDIPIKVVATRSFGRSGAWDSILHDHQRLQVLSLKSLLLAEVIASGGYIINRYQFRVTAAIPEQDRLSLIKVLSSIVTLHRFLDAINSYRSGTAALEGYKRNKKEGFQWPEL